MREDESLGEGFYRFSQPQFAEFIIHKTPQAEIQSIAHKIISYFENHTKEGLKKSLVLAHLHEISGLRASRLDRILEAANHYLSKRMKDQAAAYYMMILDSLHGSKRSRKQREIYIDAVLGIILAHGHLYPLREQRSYLKSALRIAKNLEDQERLVTVQLFYARTCEQEGNFKRAATLFDQGWNIAQKSGKEDLLKKTALGITEFLFRQGRVADAVERYEQVIGNLEEFSSDQATLRACAVLGWAYGICGQTARGLGLIEVVRIKAEEIGDKEMKIFADINTVLTLLEARRIAEADLYLNQVLSLPEEVLGYYVLWAGYSAKAYILFSRGDLNECFRFQKKAYRCSKKYGWPHHRGPWNFEYLDKLEEKGMVHPGMNYESEIKRILSWPDIFMKGVAYRFRAQRALKTSQPEKDIHRDLMKSIKLLSRAGARLELARTQIFLARVLLEENNKEKAQPLLEKAWRVMSVVNPSLFPEDLREFLSEDDREELLIKTFVEVGSVLGRVRKRKMLLEQIINLTMRFTLAEQGGFFLVNELGQPELAASRNLDAAMVSAKRFQPKMKIVEQVARSGHRIIKEPKRDLDSSKYPGNYESVCIICSPIILQDQILGVLYLAAKPTKHIFPRRDLSVLKAICNQVAIALDNVRAYEEIAELKDRLEEETRFYRTESHFSPQLAHMVGNSEAVLHVQGQMQKVAPTNSTVLITGQTGVGKELVARGIHQLSTRAKGPFIALNTASLPEGLVASELFGHEKGAFSGAVRKRTGRFELANGGTLFLDDIQNLSEETQIKLLRVLEEMEFERVGGSKTIKSDFRLITAANRSLERMVEQGQFRSDLYYRLNVFPIHVPPLEERKEDIPLLASHFLEIYRKRFGKDIRGISSLNMKRLIDYHWPGNVRELQHIIERAVILSEGESLVFPDLMATNQDKPFSGKYQSLEEMERTYIIDVLEKCNWKVSGQKGAARVLNLKPTTLYSKMKRLGIHRKTTYTGH